jgi:hypothetical protein
MRTEEDQHEEQYRVEACRCACRSWFCDRCSIRMGLSVRTALEIFMRNSGWIPFMVTLTCNPAWFKSPEDAYFFCRKLTGKFVHELVRRSQRTGSGVKLRSAHYFVGFELHKSGWPHWHIVLDATFVDIDVLRHVWNLLGRRNGKDGIGHVFFTEMKAHWTIEMAIAYVTKYLTDRPEGGWPDWIMQSEKRIRRFSSSQGLDLLAGIVKKRPRKERNPAEHDEACFCRSCRGEQKPKCRESTGECHAERVRRCGSTTVVFVVGEHEQPDGEVVERRRYVATIADSLPNTAAMFGILAEGESVVDLGNVRIETIQQLCDRKRLRDFKRQSRLEGKLRALRKKRQQSFVDLRPDRAAEAIAL